MNFSQLIRVRLVHDGPFVATRPSVCAIVATFSIYSEMT